MPRFRLGNAVNPASLDHGELSGLDGDDHLQYHTDARAKTYCDTLYAPIYSMPLKTATVTVSASEMKALNATPKTLIAAPAAGKALILVAAELWLDYGSAAYAEIAGGEDLTIKYSNDSGAVLATVETTGFLDATADAFRYVTPTTTAAFAPVAAAPLVLHLLTGEIITGDSPLKIRITYRELTLTW
jgi:hypothetical protein